MKGTAPLVARTQLRARTGLQSSGPWGRAVPLLSAPPVRPGAAEAGKGAATRKDTGPPRKVRALVLARDGYACVCCGKSIIGQRYSLGHRKRASQGGKPVPSNLLTFLGWGGEQHHGRIDRRDNPADEANGYTVRSSKDPKLIPVNRVRADGSRVRQFAWDDGLWHDEPEGALAA